MNQLRKSKSKTGQPGKQSDKFVKIAREHGCDESEQAFEEKLRKISKPKKKKRSN